MTVLFKSERQNYRNLLKLKDVEFKALLLLLLLLLLSLPPLCRVFIHIFHVLREYSVAAILSSLFMVSISLILALVLLYSYVSTFQSVCVCVRAVPNMVVFYSSLTSWFPGMLLTYFLNDFEIVPFAPIITGITLVFTFHMSSISIVRSLYLKIFSVSFLIKFLFPEIATSINIHVPFSLSRMITGGLLLGMVLSVLTC